MRKALVVLIAVLGLAFAALGAEDIVGTWKTSFDTPVGAMENTFQLKVDGDKVTGTISGGALDALEIADGKLDGDKISFSINSGSYGVIRYFGTIKGDEMKLTLALADGSFTTDLVVKRVKA